MTGPSSDRAIVNGALHHGPQDQPSEDDINDQLRLLRAREEARRRFRSSSVTALPELVRLTDFLAVPDEPVRYRIDGLMPAETRVLLAAQFKAGKTTLSGNLARALADGPTFLGRRVEPIDGRVILLDFELSPNMLRRWLRDQGIRNTDKITVVPMRGRGSAFDILDAGVRQQWAGALREHSAAFVILDCLRPVLDALGLDEDKEAGRLCEAFDALLTEAGATEGLVVHHMGHNGERSRGSSRLRDWPDVEWKLVRQDDDPASQRYFSAYGRDVDLSESALEYNALTRRLTLVGGNRADAKGRQWVPAVLELVAAEPGLSGRQLEDRLSELEATQEATRAALRLAIKLAVREGQVRTEQGERNATLHYPLGQPSAPVRRSAPPVRQRAADECASAPTPLGGGALSGAVDQGECAESLGHLEALSAPVPPNTPAARPGTPEHDAILAKLINKGGPLV